jgi:anti-sigma B factor antagonist
MISDEGRKTNMALKITSREVDGVMVLALEGRIVFGEEAAALHEKLESVLAAGKAKLVLDLKNVKMIDSSGLDTLVIAHNSAKSRGASLRLCNLGSRSSELLRITRLVKVFEVSASEEDAVRALANRATAG